MATRKRKEKLPRHSNRPEPTRNKPPVGYRLLSVDTGEMDDRLSRATNEELILLLKKGENAGAFRLYEKIGTGPEAMASASGTDVSQLEIEDIPGWPPSLTPSGAKKGGGKKSATKPRTGGAGKKTGKKAGGAKGTAAKKGSKSSKK